MLSPSERKLFALINRALVSEGSRLRICKERSRWFSELGRYYIVSDSNWVLAQHVDLATLGRELGPLPAGDAPSEPR